MQKSEAGELAFGILKLLIPLDIKSNCKRLMGREFDGGYIILDKDLDKIEAVYTVGVDFETSFEEQITYEFP